MVLFVCLSMFEHYMQPDAETACPLDMAVCESSAVTSDLSPTVSEGISWIEISFHGINNSISHIFPCSFVFLPLKAMQTNKQKMSTSHAWFALGNVERQSGALWMWARRRLLGSLPHTCRAATGNLWLCILSLPLPYSVFLVERIRQGSCLLWYEALFASLTSSSCYQGTTRATWKRKIAQVMQCSVGNYLQLHLFLFFAPWICTEACNWVGEEMYGWAGTWTLIAVLCVSLESRCQHDAHLLVIWILMILYLDDMDPDYI